MLPLFRQSNLSPWIAVQDGGQRHKPRRFQDRGYYDLTPPSEVPEPEAEPDNRSATTSTCSEGRLSSSLPPPEPLVAVIGVGYVGEHLARVFSKCLHVLGYDVSETRVKELRRSFEHCERARFTSSARDLAAATHFLVSVPTLLLPDKAINSSFLRSALTAVGKYARRGSVVVIESSVAVGMTRAFLGPLAREKALFAGMSPERVDPGRTEPAAQAIPKLVSGLDDVVPGSLEAIRALYSRVFDRVVAVSKPEVAELTKLYENCQRLLCIAFANEMADAARPHGIDPFEVCEAAATKPFGYMPLYPGLGVGGHCIPVNPHYLFANSDDFPLLRAATERMRHRPAAVAQRAVDRLLASGRQQARVLIVGMGFKRGQANLANSPSLDLARELVLSGLEVMWIDPMVQQEAVPQIQRLDMSTWDAGSLERRFELIVVAFRPPGLELGVLDELRGVEVEMWCA
ncbi:UDP-glucose/GDP-mannose dehydrogenase family, central domain-containing protein [Hirsutella rhossiliensis]|uniref:UDP-glucose/GDP-mannose dehydrogenase family, central domain-containing protein n=1 Tax=Hirsutella rhossiliensis TaxID=111463 RepID=A0A9P8SLC0_9HYPO|nr:UDP-glucose/GDP-mannose dehydrogenase family, central domain-containing protein [Hirsutella rhossiliensis]KAH0966094.1 UDP-glucose/GDP-mannose dehydrogenase family, central domain-containing protein [Hirsutella rhossiliensis]